MSHYPFSRAAATLRPRTTFRSYSAKSIDSILIANRGEIAIRVNRTAAQHGIRTTTLYTNPDALSQHALSSPFSFHLGATAAYLDQEKILRIAKQEGCQAIHPGYGFLSENAEFAKRCAEEGVTFIGPPASAIEDMGDKARSKEIMNAAGVPCVPGYHGSDQAPETLAQEAEKIGYPVLIKAVRGGGGKGMRIAKTAQEFPDMLESARSEARNSFGNDEVLVEKYITTPRHIEVQVFADKHGNCVALGERDCSIQRRHQKILEESPAPNLDDSIRKDLWDKARAAALAVNYEGAGTVEFIFDNDTGEFYFMEMNTRLQVEHPVTEMVTGLDLVHWQILVAEGKLLPLTQEQVEEQISHRGHAIEARIYAENPDKGFIPDSGKLLHVRLPKETTNVRIDSGFVQGDEVSSHYDPMIAKLIVRGETREDALRKMVAALQDYEVAGPVTNIGFLKRICKSPDFVTGNVETGYIGKHHEELFPEITVTSEVLAQAAIASFLRHSNAPTSKATSLTWQLSSPSWLNTSSDFQPRTFQFTSTSIEPGSGKQPKILAVELQQMSPGTFSLSTPSNPEPMTVSSSLDSKTNTLTTYFPNTRHTSHIIFSPASTTSDSASNPEKIHLFTPHGAFLLYSPSPPWLQKALGVTEKPNSLLSPMPAKILRVLVSPGDVVKKEQPLIVIESMKMETVIRSPIEGAKVQRVVHMEGEVVGSGVALVEFEEDGTDEGEK
ncbi:3-methylcrotonyl-CoA carboxylase alpha subunit [Cladophialophora psammophila CBS 110553]|uniref:3-methylcrotonyl-CoA carboxylase alpha subunit n=1 Tax=Cladophialophora psammophila CBS 110553 TaxID=1182543 RepID=W9WN86_9EURO|nr:3-methylcrotonyl-CoA carboxylase alpha subunit [Cladophialophora psammophila CBS 110553]EXJ66116.1 3-methylcrotonyl-CoA carboxylase alpha subunit [Cladophialophora psammophila CBS 110553]